METFCVNVAQNVALMSKLEFLASETHANATLSTYVSMGTQRREHLGNIQSQCCFFTVSKMLPFLRPYATYVEGTQQHLENRNCS